MTPSALKARVDLIEEAYEFFLAYAAQGLSGEVGDAGLSDRSDRTPDPARSSDDPGSPASRVRDYLRRCDEALTGLADGFRANLRHAADHEDAIATLDRDATAARAFVRLTLAQPAISSQLIDNLNASIHVRALLTDLFLLGDLVAMTDGKPA